MCPAPLTFWYWMLTIGGAQGDAEKTVNSLKSSVKKMQSNGPFVEYMGSGSGSTWLTNEIFQN